MQLRFYGPILISQCSTLISTNESPNLIAPLLHLNCIIKHCIPYKKKRGRRVNSYEKKVRLSPVDEMMAKSSCSEGRSVAGSAFQMFCSSVLTFVT